MKVKQQLTAEEVQEVLAVLEREVFGYSQVHVPERIVKLRSAIDKLKN